MSHRFAGTRPPILMARRLAGLWLSLIPALLSLGMPTHSAAQAMHSEPRMLADRIFEDVSQKVEPATPFALLVRFKAKPGQGDRLAELYEAQAERARRESGCLAYDVLRASNEPDTFYLYERWRDLEAFREHEYADYTLALFAAGAPLIVTEGRALRVLHFVEPEGDR